MRLRTVWRLGGTVLVALGLVLAGRWSTHLIVGGHHVARGSDLSSTVRISHVERAPSSAPPDAKLTATVRSDGSSGGVLVIRVPPPTPELCSPAHIKVGVGLTTVVACRSATYNGLIAVSVGNPAIASASASGGLMVPRYLIVVGRHAGTTTVRVSYPGGPTTSYPITVTR